MYLKIGKRERALTTSHVDIFDHANQFSFLEISKAISQITNPKVGMFEQSLFQRPIMKECMSCTRYRLLLVSL